MSTWGVSSGEVRNAETRRDRSFRPPPWVAVIALAAILVAVFVCLIVWVAVRTLTAI